jgi:hypothetical protein
VKELELRQPTEPFKEDEIFITRSESKQFFSYFPGLQKLSTYGTVGFYRHYEDHPKTFSSSVKELDITDNDETNAIKIFKSFKNVERITLRGESNSLKKIFMLIEKEGELCKSVRKLHVVEEVASEEDSKKAIAEYEKHKKSYKENGITRSFIKEGLLPCFSEVKKAPAEIEGKIRQAFPNLQQVTFVQA